jgi:hypothetical protein
MVALGLATARRPSMMRPLRREGPSADVLWEKNVVLARRAQTRADEVREATKNPQTVLTAWMLVETATWDPGRHSPSQDGVSA